ncbi:hypothetical protein OGZ51_01655 [Lactococcus lactis]|uniref:Uncharacterized protein n=1 Tax=Lactococcus lactis TaxID=1358 RepID=A0A9X4NF24_9LACT|nr:hypothetical protein [Lactococcus lactis]MDG4982855.1 hypothetical protein [Lactococcus lactis]
MTIKQENWATIPNSSRINIIRSVKNRGVFAGLTDLFEKPREDGTTLDLTYISYSPENKAVIINYTINWNGNDKERKRVVCRLSWDIFISEPFTIPVDEFKQMLIE